MVRPGWGQGNRRAFRRLIYRRFGAPRLRPDCLHSGCTLGTMRTLCACVEFGPLNCVPCWEIRVFRAGLTLFGQLAQLVRALRSHRRGHRFESCAAHCSIDSCFVVQITSRWSGAPARETSRKEVNREVYLFASP
jgi:hypothetical protein